MPKQKPRGICSECQKNPVAVNYTKKYSNQTVVYYRKKCSTCIERGKIPKWQKAGYQKKKICERCGFRPQFISQSDVWHIDQNTKNNQMSNLKTVCLNCKQALRELNLTYWPKGQISLDL